MSSGTVVLNIPLVKATADGVFHKSAAQDVVFSMKLGENEVALPLAGIRKEFQIVPESDDGVMLDLIVRALDFVTALRIGDKLPTEVLTGEPSWEITPGHRLRAYQRLTLQLATWLTGEERVFTSAEELNQIAEDPNNKRKWNEAFDEAARRLGFTENGREQVMTLITNLAEEFAYIEALRDHFDRIASIDRSAQKLRRIYGRENSIREIADSVARLLSLAKLKLDTNFQEIDAQTGEIMSVLKKPAQQVKYIRKARDDLYCRLVAWNEMMLRWEKTPIKHDDACVTLLRDTYRFLAPRYMPSVEWLLLSKLGARPQKPKTTSVVW